MSVLTAGLFSKNCGQYSQLKQRLTDPIKQINKIIVKVYWFFFVKKKHTHTKRMELIFQILVIFEFRTTLLRSKHTIALRCSINANANPYCDEHASIYAHIEIIFVCTIGFD